MRVDQRPYLAAMLFAAAILSAAHLAAQDAAPPAASGTDSAMPAVQPCSTSPLSRIGGDVSSPIVLFHVDPQFSEQARAAKFGGVVLVNLTLDICGRPQNVHVLRGVGMGLDESAVNAVKQYMFKPAMEDGKPVPVQLNVEVNFQIFQPPPPVVLHSVPLELTEEARQNKVSGTILVALTVDTHGNPQNVHVLRGVGMGMDERAVEAVKQYRFEPFVEDGQAVAKATTLQLKFDAK